MNCHHPPAAFSVTVTFWPPAFLLLLSSPRAAPGSRGNSAGLRGPPRRWLLAGLSPGGVTGTQSWGWAGAVGPIRTLSLPGPREPPSILGLGGFGMDPGTLNQHGTDPSMGTGGGFGKPSWVLPALPPSCPAAGVPQSRSCPPAQMEV